MVAVSYFYTFNCMEIIIQTHLIENEWTAKFFSTIYGKSICLNAVKGPF